MKIPGKNFTLTVNLLEVPTSMDQKRTDEELIGRYLFLFLTEELNYEHRQKK